MEGCFCWASVFHLGLCVHVVRVEVVVVPRSGDFWVGASYALWIIVFFLWLCEFFYCRVFFPIFWGGVDNCVLDVQYECFRTSECTSACVILVRRELGPCVVRVCVQCHFRDGVSGGSGGTRGILILWGYYYTRLIGLGYRRVSHFFCVEYRIGLEEHGAVFHVTRGLAVRPRVRHFFCAFGAGVSSFPARTLVRIGMFSMKACQVMLYF